MVTYTSVSNFRSSDPDLLRLAIRFLLDHARDSPSTPAMPIPSTGTHAMCQPTTCQPITSTGLGARPSGLSRAATPSAFRGKAAVASGDFEGSVREPGGRRRGESKATRGQGGNYLIEQFFQAPPSAGDVKKDDGDEKMSGTVDESLDTFSLVLDAMIREDFLGQILRSVQSDGGIQSHGFRLMHAAAAELLHVLLLRAEARCCLCPAPHGHIVCKLLHQILLKAVLPPRGDGAIDDDALIHGTTDCVLCVCVCVCLCASVCA